MTRKEFERAIKRLYASYDRQHRRYIKHQYSTAEIVALEHWKNDQLNRLTEMLYKGE